MSGFIWLDTSGGGGGGSPTGAAGGNLSGTYPNPIVAKINGASVPISGALTIGNLLQVSGISALSYGAVNLAGGIGAVTGTLPVINLPNLAGDISGTISSNTVDKINGTSVSASPSANQMLVVTSGTTSVWSQIYDGYVAASANITGSKIASATTGAVGVIQLATDLAGTATAPTVIGLNNNAVTIDSSGNFTIASLVNNSASVFKGELIRVKKNISLVHAAAANYDTTIWQAPAKFRLLGILTTFATSVVFNGITVSTIQLGRTVGGSELLIAYTLLGTETITTTPLGIATASLGTDVISGNNFQQIYMSSTTFSLRQILVSGEVTSGSIDVELVGYQF